MPADVKFMSWRDYRTCSPKQRLMLDWITKQGRFANVGGRRRYGKYGGAGWGGKSHLLRTAAFEICYRFRELGYPNQWVTLYTKTYPDLEDRHIRKIPEEYGGIGTFSDSNRYGLHVKWHEEGLGGLFLRNVESSSGTGRGGGKKPGAESVGALIEEVTEFTYDEFASINYVTRPGKLNVPFIPILAVGNPDGIGHKWCKEIFIPKYRKLYRSFFEKVSPDDILFVQAFMRDNPAYEQQKDVVEAIFAMIEDPDIRKAREDGSWDLYVSGRFNMWRDELHGFVWEDLFSEYGVPFDMEPAEFLKECHYFGFTAYESLDYGTSETSISALYLHLVGPDNRPWTVARLRMSGLELEEQAERIKAFEEKMGVRIVLRYADPSLWGKDKRSDQFTRAERFRREGLVFMAGVNDRVEGAATVAFMLGWAKSPDGTVARPPRWRIHRGEAFWPGCPELFEQIPDLPRDPSNPEDVDPRDGKNHDYDSARYFLHTRFRGGRSTDRTLLAPGTPAWFREVARLQKRGKQTGDWL